MTEIIDGIYTRTQGYGTPFHTALTCLKCGAMVDGNTYAPAPTPRQVHIEWHATMLELLELITSGVGALRRAKPPADTSWVKTTEGEAS